MTTKQYLNQLRNIDREIEDFQLLALRYRDSALPTSPQLTDMKVQTSHEPDKMANSIVKAIDFEREADEKASMLMELKHLIISQICGVKEVNNRNATVYYNVLFGYYIRGMRDAKLSDYVGYEKRYTKKLFNRALETFETLYGSTYLDT